MTFFKKKFDEFDRSVPAPAGVVQTSDVDEIMALAGHSMMPTFSHFIVITL